MFWFLEDVDRLLHERTALEERAGSAPWLKGFAWSLPGGELVVDADIEAHDHVYQVRMTYPQQFPACLPSVRLRDEASSSTRISTHQYMSGELCLEWAADTWEPEVTGAQMLESAHRLFEIENPLGTASVDPREVAPSRHRLTQGQELRFEFFRFVATSTLRERTRSLADGSNGTITLLYFVFQDKGSALVVQTMTTVDNAWSDATVPSRIQHYAIVKQGLFYCSDTWRRDAEPNSVAALLSAFDDDEDFRGRLQGAIETGTAAYLLVIDGERQLHLLHLSEKDGVVAAISGIDAAEAFNSLRVGVETARLRTKRVGIVGLGSAGSKIAVSLARAGVGSFVLVDDDVLLPENLVRNDLDWRNVGEHKVDAVADRLGVIAPGVTIDRRRVRLAGQESNTTTAGVLRALGECDLIIDATADPEAFNLLSFVATKSQRMMTWLEVFGGGLGGLVGRYRPDKDPAPQRMREAFNAYSTTTEDPPASAGQYQVRDGKGEVLTALDSDVGVIANWAVHVAIDQLLESEPSLFPYSMYLIGLRRGWIFDAPFHTIPLETGPPDKAHAPETSPESLKAGLDFIGELLAQSTNAASPTDGT